MLYIKYSGSKLAEKHIETRILDCTENQKSNVYETCFFSSNLFDICYKCILSHLNLCNAQSNLC